MKPQQLTEFYRLLCNGTYNNVAASYAIGQYKTMKICLYLSCEPCSFIEYGDFLPQSLPNELREIFMQDGYFDEQGTATEKAQRMLVWQVWLKYYNDTLRRNRIITEKEYLRMHEAILIRTGRLLQEVQ